MGNRIYTFSGMFAVLSVWFLLSGAQSIQGATPAAYQAAPVIASTSEPPLVMIVMGRDHKLYFEAYNDASDLDGDGELDLYYNPDIDYYGYFDSYKTYTYDSTDERFEPYGETTDKKVTGTGQWSGDYLNYLTMSRMDCLRKVLYGGYRSTDTATETVLERAYIPPDAHTWGKEYYSEARDGYDIADYTPLSAPASGTYHLFASTSQCGSSDSCDPLLRVLEDRSERIWEWVTIAFQDGIGGTTLGTPDDYAVRVLVGDEDMPEDNCKLYSDSSGTSVYKPIGLLQKYGETQQMYFGLITGSYAKNFSGGVLRRNIGDISEEINSDTGVFKTDVNGIIQTINNLRLMGLVYEENTASLSPFSNTSSMYASLSSILYPSTLYAKSNDNNNNDNNNNNNSDGDGYENCSWTSVAREEGECAMWGNPIGEMMYETLRYFAGESATTDFIYDGSEENSYDDDLGLNLATWEDPYDEDDGYPSCSKPFMLVISDISPSYDSDQYETLDMSDPNSYTVAALAKIIGEAEFEDQTVKRFIGETGTATDTDGVCSEKSITSFANISGLCPEEPSKDGSYYSASVAYYGNRYELDSGQTVGTFAVGLASPLPEINITVGDSKIALVPFGKSVGGSAGDATVSSTKGDYQPSDAIVDFYVDTLTDTYGKFRINFEDMEEGSDYDMDTLVIYEYQVVDASYSDVDDAADGVYVKITLTATEASASIIQHNGYIISGTTMDGTYLVIRDSETAEASDPDYYLDTPLADGNDLLIDTSADLASYNDSDPLPQTDTRYFKPDSSSSDETAALLKNPLWYAGKWGGFEDQNDNGEPDLDEEWDTNADGVPDNYFYVTNATYLEDQLNSAFSAIAATAASGTSSSVLATNSDGDGTLFQAYFRPVYTSATGEELSWIGYLNALWMDSDGNIREDTNNDHALKTSEDKEIEFVVEDSVTKVRRYALDSSGSYDTIALDEIVPIWEAGSVLADTDEDDRKIYTSIEGATDWTEFDTDTANIEAFKYYLGVSDDDKSAFPTANIGLLGDDLDERADTLTRYIRGEDFDELRNRTVDGDVWKLGDIIYSTPVSISGAVENYHKVYSDDTYADYAQAQKASDPMTVVYAGANDGMLHAFYGGTYNETTDAFEEEDGMTIGSELWAYIPKAVLPHLKWLADPGYDHTYYVDLRPKIFDAPIANGNGEWGTFLLLGLNMGGKDIAVDYTGDDVMDSMAPTYTLLDITDPANPKFMWEKSYEELGMSRSLPTIIKVGGDYWAYDTILEDYVWTEDSDAKWLAVFGSGPHGDDAYEGKSDQSGHIYVIDLETGTPYTNADGDDYLFTTSDNAVINWPENLDNGLTYEVNAVYFGESFPDDTDELVGRVWSFDTYDHSDTEFTKEDPVYWGVDDDPGNWHLHLLLEEFTDASGTTVSLPPITGPMNLSTDDYDNIWVYFGTGRFISDGDKKTEGQQYLFGLKDPLFNAAREYGNWAYEDDDTQMIDFSSDKGGLLYSNNYEIYTDKTVKVYDASGTYLEDWDWDELVYQVRWDPDDGDDEDDGDSDNNADTDSQWLDGWVRELGAWSPSERCISEFSILGGAVFVAAYTPSEEACSLGGSSRLFGLWYETGTAYYEPILDTGSDDQSLETIDLGDGVPPTTSGFTPDGEKIITQLSTGQVTDDDADPPLQYKSRITNWYD